MPNNTQAMTKKCRLADELEKDSYLRVASEHRHWLPCQIYLIVPGLPRGADVEIQPLAGCQSGSAKSDSESDKSEEGLQISR